MRHSRRPPGPYWVVWQQEVCVVSQAGAHLHGSIEWVEAMLSARSGASPSTVGSAMAHGTTPSNVLITTWWSALFGLQQTHCGQSASFIVGWKVTEVRVCTRLQVSITCRRGIFKGPFCDVVPATACSIDRSENVPRQNLWKRVDESAGRSAHATGCACSADSRSMYGETKKNRVSRLE